MYGLGGLDTSDTSVEEGAAVRVGAPDFTVPMHVLACTVASHGESPGRRHLAMPGKQLRRENTSVNQRMCSTL